MRFISVLSIIIITLSQSKDLSFITDYEYGRELYKNPRGIGCNECHGEKAEGMIIARYKHKNKDKILFTEPLNVANYDSFVKSFQKTEKSKVMPKYFLTDSELRSIYKYLLSVKKER